MFSAERLWSQIFQVRIHHRQYPKQMKNFLVPKNLSGCRSIRGFPGIGNQVGQHLYDLACVPRMTGPEDGKSVLSRVLLGAAA